MAGRPTHCLVAYWRPEPGILLVIAFDIGFAGCVVPPFYGVHSKRATAHAQIAAILVGTSCRLIAYFLTPAHWAALDTLLPPVLSWISFVTVMKLNRTAENAEIRNAVVTAHGD